jgi:hypothetical protein
MIKVSYLTTPEIAPYVARGVVVWELALCVLLLIPKTRNTAAWGYIVTWLGFSAYAIWRMVMHINAPCSCFGGLFKLTPSTSLLLCVVLLVVTNKLLTLISISNTSVGVGMV